MMCRARPWILLGVTIIVLLAAMLAAPVAQDPTYHLFADERSWLGVPNSLNVLSNIPFAIVGAIALVFILRNPACIANAKAAWIVFFIGIFLTAFGSGYYHLYPTNGPLVWDRLPMTIGFMAFVAAVIAEYFSPNWGRRLLIPLLIAGFASVSWWHHTESLGQGDLRPYAVVQFLPMLLIPLVAWTYRERSDLGRWIAWMILFYVLAKIAEQLDYQLLGMGDLMSGHSLKHLLAAVAPAAMLMGLQRRVSIG